MSVVRRNSCLKASGVEMNGLVRRTTFDLLLLQERQKATGLALECKLEVVRTEAGKAALVVLWKQQSQLTFGFSGCGFD